jgi:hypothetical protein
MAATKAPVLSWKDDYATRHPMVTAKTKVLDGRHQHLGELQ